MQYRTLRPALLLALIAGLLLSAVGCDLSPTNPNNPSEEQVLTTTEGIRTLTVGMQEFYATSTLGATLTTTGVTSREIAVNTTFANLIELEAGGTDLNSGNANVESIWSSNYRVLAMAEDLIQNAPQVNFTAGTESGVVATAHLFKAMALGNIAGVFEQAPIQTTREGNAEFVPRRQVYQEAVNQLNTALSTLDDTPPSDDFASNILATGLDLRNTIHAYRARFNLLAGNSQAAIDAANQVDPAAQSTFNYDDQSQNPGWGAFFQSANFAPRDSFGTRLTLPGDARVDHFTNALVDSTSQGSGLPIDQSAVYTSSTAPFPLYVPGEMPLIRAEAKLNQGAASSEVIAEINAVRTKTASEDPFGIGADLPPYDGPETEAALRTEILRQRRAELYLQGLALADSRRLGPEVSDRQTPGPYERSRNFYPYPDQESRNNPNTPESPDF
jgi:hypothetical protein